MLPPLSGAWMRAKARELGWRVRRSNVFRETHTGEGVFERPVLTRLRQRVARGDIEAVLFYDVDRFARDPVWIEMVTQECFHFGAQVAFVRGGDDLSRDTPEARVLRMLKGYAAKTELGQIKERVARGHRARLDAGRLNPCSTGPLYGYRYVDADQPDPGKKHPAPKVRYAVDEDLASIIRQVFAWATLGWTIRAIACRGVPGPRGPEWSPSKCAAATRWCARKSCVRQRRGCAIQTASSHPFIDQQTFDAAKLLRDAHKRNPARRCLDPREILAPRRIRPLCGECCDRLYVHRQSLGYGQRTSYWCTSRKHGRDLPPEQRRRNGVKVVIRADTLDAAVWGCVVDLLDNPDHLIAELQRMRANDPTETDLAAIDRSLVKVSRGIDGLTKGFAAVQTDDARNSRISTRRRRSPPAAAPG